MDIKKSHDADLDSSRMPGYLIGLVVTLSLFLIALEFTVRSTPPEANGDVLDDVAEDMEMTPVPDWNSMTAVAQKGMTASSGRLTVVDKRTKGNAQAGESGLQGTLGAPIGGDAMNGIINGGGVSVVTDIANTAIPPVTASQSDSNPLNFHIVEQLPEFPGGMSAFVQWLSKNLKYPVAAQLAKRQGTVLVSFIINKDGSTADYKVVKSASPELDREALRVIRMMPKWAPGKNEGKPCRTYFCIPIVFKL